MWLVGKEVGQRRTESWGLVRGGGRTDEEPRPEGLVGEKGKAREERSHAGEGNRSTDGYGPGERLWEE